MKCTKCNQEIPDNSKFCLHCGAKVETIGGLVCPKCGYKNPLDATFCTECGKSLQNVLQCSNDLDPSRYNFLQFRGVQIFGSVANVEEKLLSLGYKGKDGLFVGSYAGYENCTIEIRVTGATKHVNELLIMFDPSASIDGFQVRAELISAIRKKYHIEERKVKKGFTFDTLYGTINLHVNTSYHTNRLEVLLRGIDSVYAQYEADRTKLKYDKKIASIAQGL